MNLEKWFSDVRISKLEMQLLSESLDYAEKSQLPNQTQKQEQGD